MGGARVLVAATLAAERFYQNGNGGWDSMVLAKETGHVRTS
jgi:hypothetical protein